MPDSVETPAPVKMTAARAAPQHFCQVGGRFVPVYFSVPQSAEIHVASNEFDTSIGRPCKDALNM